MIRVRCASESGTIVRTVKTAAIWAGTGIEHIPITPDKAAQFEKLRSQRPGHVVTVDQFGVMGIALEASSRPSGTLLLAADWRVEK